MSLRLLVDEDTQSRRLVELLRQAGHDVLTANEAELCGHPDAQALARAVREHRVLLTQNCGDFRELHGRDASHAGILAIYHDCDVSKNMTYQEVVRAITNIEASGIKLAGEFIALNAWRY